MNEVKETRTYQVKENGKYRTTFIEDNPNDVHRQLMNAMIAHYLLKRQTIKKIVRKPRNDGYETVIVYHAFEFRTSRDVYVVKMM